MRLILLATALVALALPAQAQRLDTRVRDVRTTSQGVECRLNANPAMKIEPEAADSPAMAFLLQKPVESEPALSLGLGFSFDPREGRRFGVGANFFGLNILHLRMAPPPPPASVRLLLDGTDSGVAFEIHAEDNPNNIFVEVPDALHAETADRMLRARWIDVELRGSDGTVRRYRFDGLRIRDAAEILGIVKFSCDGGRAD